MSRLEEFSQNFSEIESEAGDWIVRLDGDAPLTEIEEAEFLEWLNRSPVHRDTLTKYNTYLSSPYLAELLFADNKPKQKKQTYPKLIPAMAVTFCLLVVLAMNILWQSNLIFTTNENLVYATDIGTQSEITLDDGSHLILNSNSQIEVKYTKSARDILLLKGEVFFEVAKNKTRPFNVYVANGRVQAVGTAFNIDISNKNELNVLVTEGKIAFGYKKTADTSMTDVAKMEDIAFMEKGDFMSIESYATFESVKRTITTKIVELSQNDIQNKQVWQNGEVTFAGETLAEAIEELKRYSTLKIEVVDPSLNEIRIGARFHIDQIETFLQTLEDNFNLVVQKNVNGVVQISKPKD